METSNHCFYIVENIFIFDCVLLIDFEWKNGTIKTNILTSAFMSTQQYYFQNSKGK